jgi:D-alanyl-D-alanine dipeptidase
MRAPDRLIALGTLAALFGASGCRAHPATIAPTLMPPPTIAVAEQLVVVTTPDWSSTVGSLTRFARASTSASWQRASAAIPVVVGRTGLAWGIGFDADASPSAPHKHEGDGRSPAGAFPLDTVFGFAPAAEMSWVRLPYAMLTAASDCVDDTTSAHYNTVVRRDAVPVDWNSAEHMRSIWQYELGVIVGYNAAPPRRGRGSCIFLHIWDGPASHTAGCTAFDRAALREVVEWLEPRAHPVLVQLPADEYTRLERAWGLPPLH